MNNLPTLLVPGKLISDDEVALKSSFARAIVIACVKLPKENATEETLEIVKTLDDRYRTYRNRLAQLHAMESAAIEAIQATVNSAYKYLKDGKYEDYYSALSELCSCTEEPTCERPIQNGKTVEIIAQFICKKCLEFGCINDQEACRTLREVILEERRICLVYECMGRK
jgi:hypothetical protein